MKIQSIGFYKNENWNIKNTNDWVNKYMNIKPINSYYDDHDNHIYYVFVEKNNFLSKTFNKVKYITKYLENDIKLILYKNI